MELTREKNTVTLALPASVARHEVFAVARRAEQLIAERAMSFAHVRVAVVAHAITITTTNANEAELKNAEYVLTRAFRAV